MDYPAELRTFLASQKRAGVEFEVAWQDGRGVIVAPKEWDDRGLQRFLKKHMRDAYTNAPTLLGRLVLDPRDTHEGMRRPLIGLPAVAYCRSGDGCDRPATVERNGRLMWCEMHSAELERIADKLQLRPQFNKFIFGTRGKEPVAA